MKCKLTEVWHRGYCKCVEKLHLNLDNKYCICFNDSGNYCKDTWKIVNQEIAKVYWYHMKKDYLEEFFEYV